MPRRPFRRRTRQARGYGREHQQARAELIDAEPWCHDPACTATDVGSVRNPLTREHGPEGDTVLCLRCNSARRWQRG